MLCFSGFDLYSRWLPPNGVGKRNVKEPKRLRKVLAESSSGKKQQLTTTTTTGSGMNRQTKVLCKNDLFIYIYLNLLRLHTLTSKDLSAVHERS